jgi:hypothetical protein
MDAVVGWGLEDFRRDGTNMTRLITLIIARMQKRRVAYILECIILL